MRLLPDNSLSATLWDTALLEHQGAHFLQSWAWGEFMSTLGNRIWRLAVERNGEVINQLLITKLSLGFGWSLLYAPKGNLVNKHLSASDQQASAELLLSTVRDLGRTEKVILFRIDPPISPDDKTSASIYRTLGFKTSTKHIQPPYSSVLSLAKSPDALLENMKPKTRYNIRLAEKKGVQASLSHNPEDIQIFINLTHQTSARDNFKAHHDNYYRAQFKLLHSAGIQDLWLAYVGKTPVASILVNKFGHLATYVHGASSDTHRNLMAPYLLQFVAIQHYYADGFKAYDFWGTHPDPSHPWAGITRFKSGFGGQDVTYIGTLEWPLHPTLSRLYTFINRFR